VWVSHRSFIIYIYSLKSSNGSSKSSDISYFPNELTNLGFLDLSFFRDYVLDLDIKYNVIPQFSLIQLILTTYLKLLFLTL